MTRIPTFLALALPIVLLTAPAQHAVAQCLAPGFEGKWQGNDGGSYVISSAGGSVYWTGRSGDNGKSWVNRFKGEFGDNKTISGEWHDTGKPWGHGTMTVKMVDDHTLVRTSATGSYFGGTRWTRPVPSRGCDDTR